VIRSRRFIDDNLRTAINFLAHPRTSERLIDLDLSYVQPPQCSSRSSSFAHRLRNVYKGICDVRDARGARCLCEHVRGIRKSRVSIERFDGRIGKVAVRRFGDSTTVFPL
jgi:hypothetical protein